MSTGGSLDLSTISNVLADRRAEFHRNRRGLLIRLMAEAPFHRADNFWLTIELPELAAVLPKSGRGLEIGCGDGRLTGIMRDMLDANWELVGADPEVDEIRSAHRRGLYSKLHHGPLNKIPEPNRSFEFVFANNVLQRFADPQPIVSEIGRCLMKQGVFAATIPSVGLYGMLRKTPRRIDSREAYFAEIDRRLGAARRSTFDRWIGLLDDAGINLFELRCYMSPRQLGRWERMAQRGWRKRHRAAEAGVAPSRPRRPEKGLSPTFRFLSHPAAWITAFGVIDDEVDNPYEAGGWLILGQRR